jgi:hypothetical protein
MCPLQAAPRGDNVGGSGVTNHAARGDTAVTRNVLEPSLEPSSSPPAPGRTLAPAVVAGGGLNNGIVADVLAVLPEPGPRSPQHRAERHRSSRPDA